MINMRQCLLVATLGLAAALAGCASPSPNLYTIAPVGPASDATTQPPAIGQKAGYQVVVLQQIGLARYLERAQIVRSSENYKLDVSSNDWWGEPLAAMISRVLIDELGQRLPQSTILNESGAVTAAPDVTVELNISRLDLDAAGDLILDAQASVDGRAQKEPVLQHFRFTVHPSGPDVQAQVAATSAALGQLADKLAPTIQAGSIAK